MLNPDQFLPGTESVMPALPHEQTESQFMNRPDVYVHGRYVHQTAGAVSERHVGSFDFHAGTRKAAHERLSGSETGHGVPWDNHVPKFFYGRVEHRFMHNSPDESLDHDPGGRLRDQSEDWDWRHLDHYYKNDYEDKGSTSVILANRDQEGHPLRTATETKQVPGKVWNGAKGAYERGMVEHSTTADIPQNFHSWRDSVGSALNSGVSVPAHVQALYHATGGAAGRHSVHDTEFVTPTDRQDRYSGDEPMFHGTKQRYGIWSWRTAGDRSTSRVL